MERQVPNSSPRYSSIDGNSSSSLYLMGQSVLLITRLLMGGFLHINELDPIRRYAPSYDRVLWNRKVLRSYAFQVNICFIILFSNKN